MLRHVMVTSVLLVGGASSALAQECLHLQNETAMDRTRREQAIQFARRLNVAQQISPPPSQGQGTGHPTNS